MPNPFRRPFKPGALVPVLLLCLSGLIAPSANAQTSTIPAGLQKQLDRIDLSVDVAGYISDSVSGLEQRDANGLVTTSTGTSTNGSITTTVNATMNTSGTTLRIKPSNTISELGTLRYTARPYLGFEFNFGNSRYTENTLFTSTTKTTTTTVVTPPTPPTTTTTTTTTTNFPSILPGGVQNNVHELTLGYVAHPHKLIWGIQPFLGAGGGTMQFRPTPGGGQGLPRQFRAVYYYNVGLEDYFPGSDHFGVRLGFRQLIYLAPDFGQNYLTITRRERTSEPYFDFYARF